MSLTSLLYRGGRRAVRHRRLVIVAWVIVAVGLVVTARLAGSAFVDDFRIPGAEAQAATDRVRERIPGIAGVTATVVYHATEGTLEDPAAMAAVKRTLVAVALLPSVVGVDDPTQPGGQAGVSADRTIAFTTIHYEGEFSELGIEAADRLAEAVAPARAAGLQVETGGPLVEFTHLPETRSSEIAGIVAAIVVLFIAFGSAVAMGLPIVTALVGLGTSLAIMWLLSYLGDVPSPTSAVTIGSPIATTEPNAMNSTTTAATIPTTSELRVSGRWVNSTSGPPVSTCRPAASAGATAAARRSAASTPRVENSPS